MKRIVVFGASGGTGREVVEQAIEKGFEVTAVVRRRDTFALQHQRLKVVSGDVLQLSSFENEVAGNDAVISCLGTGGGLGATTLYSRGIENIMLAMRRGDVRRLLCISAGGVEATDEMGFLIRSMTRLVLQRILKNLYEDMSRMERALEASHLDWTTLRPARLTDRPKTENYRAVVNAHVKRPWTIGRADLAHYMLSILDDEKTFRAKIEIAY